MHSDAKVLAFSTKLYHANAPAVLYALRHVGGNKHGQTFYLGYSRHPIKREAQHRTGMCRSTSGYIKFLRLFGLDFKLQILAFFDRAAEAHSLEQKCIRTARKQERGLINEGKISILYNEPDTVL